MDLNNTSAVIRPRIGWEAIDLGFLMAKRWFIPAIKAWVTITLPLYTILLIAFFPNSLVATVIYWWFKPIWERIPLHIYSQALFGSAPSLKETLKAFPRLAINQGLQAVTIRRLSPTRSFDQPVNQLEGLTGNERQQRLRVLHYSDSSTACWLLLILAHLELAFSFAFVVLIALFIPQHIEIDWITFLTGESKSAIYFILEAVIYYFIVTVIALFYTGGGFSLYLNRRTLLEGWDIELAFRQLDQRTKEIRSTRNKSNVMPNLLAAFIIVTSGILPSTTYAVEPYQEDIAIENSMNRNTPQKKFNFDTANPTHEKTDQSKIDYSHLNKHSSQHIIDIILAGEEFHNRTLIDKLQRKNDKEEAPALPDDYLTQIKALLDSLIGWYDELRLVAKGIQIILFTLVLILASTVIYKYRHWLKTLSFKHENKNRISPIQDTLFDPKVEEKSLPTQPAEQTLILWNNGNYREALSLLYRSTLAYLVFKYNFNFDESLTEAECVTLVDDSQHPSIHRYLKQVTIEWQSLAYGHRLPKKEVIENLCQQWAVLFQPMPVTDINSSPATIKGPSFKEPTINAQQNGISQSNDE